jgi:nicotinamide riboside kinase
MKIALLVAPGTGKTWLAQALQAALRTRGHSAQVLASSERAVTACDYAIADATALVAAVQHDIALQDTSFLPGAVAAQAKFDLTLLMGLDLLQDHSGIQQQVDARLRKVLQAHGLRYSVVYGKGDQRLACALAAIEQWESPSSWDLGEGQPRWQWVCDKCSDAQCEHQLFSALLGKAPQNA